MKSHSPTGYKGNHSGIWVSVTVRTGQSLEVRPTPEFGCKARASREEGGLCQIQLLVRRGTYLDALRGGSQGTVTSCSNTPSRPSLP